jgi:ATP synthase protein I
MSNEGKGDDLRRGEISPEDRASIKERSSEIARKLDEARGKSKDQSGVGSQGDRMANSPGGASDGNRLNVEAMGRGLRMSTELIGGILVGSAMGWGLDTWLGTWPWFFILFFLLGSAAGMLNVVRAGLSMKSGPVDPSKGPRKPDDDENS